jgi:hypothetical protein
MKEEKEHKSTSGKLNKGNVFIVPTDYFETLTKRIEEKTLEGNKTFRKNIFKLPANYFEELKERTLEQTIKIKKQKEAVFDVYEEYFEDLQHDTLAKVAPTAELKIKSPHIVPNHYFETLKNNINHRIHTKHNVVRFEPFFSKSVQYGMAASIVLLCLLGAIFYFQNHQKTFQTATISAKVELNTAAMIAKLEKKEVINHLEYEEIDTQDLLKFSTEDKKLRIKKDFEKELLTIKDKQSIESILEDIDISALETEI